MAKRKKKLFQPQAIAPEIKKRFEALMVKKTPVNHIDQKYSSISINPLYQNEEDLKL